jgi:hypothetical protein
MNPLELWIEPDAFQARKVLPGHVRPRVIRFLALALALGATLALLVLVARSAPSAQSLMVPGNPAPHPVPNAHTAPATGTVSITYDEPISSTTISTRTFAVHAMQTGLLTQAYGVEGGTILLTPTQPFHPGELVQATATTATLSLVDATGPVSPTVWQFRVVVPNGSGLFSSTLTSVNISATQDIVLGDLDGDGALDAFVVTVEANQVWLNDGAGNFVNSGQGLGTAFSLAVALGDLDGDGDLDAFVGNAAWSGAQPNRVWLNQGGFQAGTPGTFAGGQSLDIAHSNGVALGDMDGDGDLDAFVANGESQTNSVWLNQGDGTFVSNGQSLGNANSLSVLLGDLDGDGDLDAFVGNLGANEVWLNRGDASFADSGQRLGGVGSYDLDLGDLDGDGDLDVFVANSDPFTNANRVWLNAGDGLFEIGQAVGDSDSVAVALGDLDADGDLDACVANYDQTNEVWLNDGQGVYQDSGLGLGAASWYAALGDVDSDGDMDAFVSDGGGGRSAISSGAGVKVWRNLSSPGAADDAYLTGKDTPLSVAPPGVLANDSDPDSISLTAGLESGPHQGTLSLSADGLFTYTPTVGFTGVDTFTYAASDGVLTDVAQVTIDVVGAPNPPALISPPDGAILSDTRPALTWLASTGLDVEGYLLDWNGAVLDVGDVTYYTVTAQADGGYTWTVAAYGSLFTSTYTDAWSFNVDTTPPDPPVLVGPPDGATLGDSKPVLTWLSSPSPDAAGYLLDWDGAVLDVGAVTRYTVSVLSDGVYTWTVAAYDALRNTGAYTDTRSFAVATGYRVYLPLIVRSGSTQASGISVP